MSCDRCPGFELGHLSGPAVGAASLAWNLLLDSCEGNSKKGLWPGLRWGPWVLDIEPVPRLNVPQGGSFHPSWAGLGCPLHRFDYGQHLQWLGKYLGVHLPPLTSAASYPTGSQQRLPLH